MKRRAPVAVVPPPRRPRGRTPARAHASRGRGRAALLALAFLVALGTLAGWWFTRPRARPAPVGDPSTTRAALLESLQVADAAQDWERQLVLTRLLVDREPRSSPLLLGLGLAWNNYAWVGGRYARARTSTRTTLERMRIERWAFQLLDSAATVARTPEGLTLVQVWRGQMYENLGLPADALALYQSALGRSPGDAKARERTSFVMKQFHDPVAPPGARP